MHSISPILRRLSKRTAATPDASAWLDADEAFALWGAVLDGALQELELGALLASFAIAGESPDELLGLHRALAARQARFSPGTARRAVAIPVYGLVPGESALAVLLALFLRRFDVPVVMHGPLDSPDGPSAPALLRELGVMPSATLGEAERELRDAGIAFLPVQLLSPALGDLLALRTRLGATNSAHLAAHAMDPGAIGAVRLAMCVAGTPERAPRGAAARDGRRGVAAVLARGDARGQSRLPAANLAAVRRRADRRLRGGKRRAGRARGAGRVRGPRALDARGHRATGARTPAAREPRRRLRARGRRGDRPDAGEGDRGPPVGAAGRVTIA